MSSTNYSRISTFRRTVWSYWKKHGRHDLPWRKTKDPYRILVSEVMLQQTQVSRVKEKYKELLKAFPSVRVLAEAKLSDVLKVWSGLGYNRRGKYLHDAAKVVVSKFKGNFRKALEHSLPGVGPYTEAAVKVFAFNEPDVLIETNIRTSLMYHFFHGRPTRSTIPDSEIMPFANCAAKGQDPCTWHWALMDYGAHLKRSGIRNNVRSAHYTKQSKFEGSLRQVRGEILRQLHNGPSSLKNLKFKSSNIQNALASLARDGLIVKEKGKWQIS